MTDAAGAELRAALITAIKASAGVQATAMGAQPRVFDEAVPPGTAFPYLIVDTGNARPWDTTTDRGGELDVNVRLRGEYLGKKQGEAIYWALQLLLRDWAPQAFSAHRLMNLEFRFQDLRPEEDGKRYFGDQRWRAITEEL